VEKQNKPIATFEIFIGGMFIAPREKSRGRGQNKRDASLAPRNILMKHLKKETDLVKQLWDLENGIPPSDRLGSRYVVIGNVEKGRFQELTYFLNVPVICQLIVNKGTKYKDLYGRNRETSDAFNAIILHNGVWFMAIAYDHKYESLSVYESPGPTLRDIYETMLTKSRSFNPSSVPPSIIPKTIGVSIYKEITKKRSIKKARVIFKNHSVNSDASELTLNYELIGTQISNEYLIAQILQDIYYNISQPLDDFYVDVHDSNKISLEHEVILEDYENACKYLRAYYDTPIWEIIKKFTIAGNLKKKTSDIQVRLVDSRLSQLRMLTKASKIDMYKDNIGVIDYLRPYLRECIEQDFILGKDEYEGLSATVTHMHSIAMQLDAVILAVVAIIAGIIGAVIGVVFSKP
jgi:hypothetical protein